MKQTVTSAATSINKNKLPAIYGKLSGILHDCYLVDYGCGKYTDLQKKWSEDRNINYLPYDPFNQSEEMNAETLQKWEEARKENALPVVVICSNVLNVIDSDDVVWEVVESCRRWSDLLYVTVYEGNGSGIGKKTGKDSYQRNAKLRDYLRFFPAAARIERGVIGCLGAKYDKPRFVSGRFDENEW